MWVKNKTAVEGFFQTRFELVDGTVDVCLTFAQKIAKVIYHLILDQQYGWVLFTPQPLQYLVLFVFFIHSFISRICGWVWVSHCGFNPSFLKEMRLNTFSCAAWLFANLSFWSVSSGLLPIFYYAVVIVVYGVLEYFYTLHIIHILEIWFANIFSHLLAYLFIL